MLVHKNLTSLPAFAGLCVHEAIEGWFELKRAGTPMAGGELFKEARDRANEGWKASVGGLWKDDPRKAAHLIEHHYGENIAPEKIAQARSRIKKSTEFFCESSDLQLARDSHPDNWLAMEDLDSFPFSGVKVYAVPDFVHRDGEKVHIWDWKTGRPREEDRFQLKTYALFVQYKWGVEPENIFLHGAYLGEESVESFGVSAADLVAVEGEIEESLRPMKAGHYDPDQESPDLTQFPPTGSPHECPGCRFRGICPEAAL